MQTHLSNTLEVTNSSRLLQARYDTSVKEMLANKQILARILKYTLEEFSWYSIPEIMKRISDPVIGKMRMEPGLTNTEKVTKTSEEDNVPGEGKIFYDIRFSAYLDEEPIKVLMNIEAQKSSRKTKIGYSLDNRVIYYLGRMISAQKEVEFAKSEYDGLKPVRSIWICMDAGSDEDSIDRIRLSQDTIHGKPMILPNLGKVQAVIIRIRKDDDVEKSKNKLIAMLEELLGKRTATEKKAVLSKEHGLVMSDDTVRKVNTMCNLSENLIEEGLAKGESIGIAKGKVETLVSLVKENLLDVSIAAERCEMTIDEFKKLLEKTSP